MTAAEFRYKTIGTSGQSLYRALGSKHIGQTFHIASEAQIKGILETLWKNHADASHICYAWKLGMTNDKFRTNDDGEPSGTAGKPIYGQILSSGLTNVLVTVIRYYEGTKLGTSGLIDAYKTAARLAIKDSEIVEKEVCIRLKFLFPYQKMAQVMDLLKSLNFEKLEMETSSEVMMHCFIPKKFLDRLERTAPELTLEIMEIEEV